MPEFAQAVPIDYPVMSSMFRIWNKSTADESLCIVNHEDNNFSLYQFLILNHDLN